MSLGDFFDRPTLRLLRTATETVQAIGLLVTTTSSAGILVYLAVRPHLDGDIVTVTAVGVASSCVTLLACRLRRARHTVPTSYDILEIHGELLIEQLGDHHRYTYTKEQVIRSERDDLRLVELRTHWTGEGSRHKFEIRPLFGHVLLDGGQVEEDHRLYRWIYPGHPVGRGQTLRVGIHQVHQDDLVPQQPYYRDGGGRFRTRTIRVVARFPLVEDPFAVEGAVWNSNRRPGRSRLVGPVAYRREVNRSAGTVDYIVSVRHPRRHHSYGVRWTWPENPPQAPSGSAGDSSGRITGSAL